MVFVSSVIGLLAVAASVSAGVITIPLKARASGQNVPVTDWFNRTDNQWYSTISIGTPPQEMTVLWDTGSSDLLLPRSTCTTCANKTLFDSSKSTTFSNKPGTRRQALFSTGADSIPFSVPEGASGLTVHDTVKLGSLSVASQEFLLCDKYAAALDTMPIDGIMGMGPPSSGTDKAWYWNLYANGLLDSPVFSFYTPPGELEGGVLTLGGIDNTKYTGQITYTAFSGGGFTLAQSSILINGKAFTGSSAKGSAILDTGTAFMQTPSYAVAKQLYAQISSQITQIDEAGAWGASCDVLDQVAPDLTFVLAGQKLVIPKKSFNLGEYPGQPGICQALFNNPLSNFGGWLVGSPLLKQYYTVWDGVNKKIGWAQLVGSDLTVV
ncbi:pregnancy-associated glycoprotein 2 precursor [Xylariales sp. AK1849]|nr:pregnancy-associated glycoprotein 2 precursor [Xylariales sp. AK1849]